MSIKIIKSEKSWIEGGAIQQLEAVAELSGFVNAIGLPDLHQGKGFPIGAAFSTTGMIYPFYVGNDIGCGIGLWQLDLLQRKIKKDKLAKKLENFDHQDISDLLNKVPLSESTRNYASELGSIGGSNHFAELQIVERVVNQELFDNLHLDKNNVMVAVHSGSRYFGESVLRRYVDKHKDKGVLASSVEGQEYLAEHDAAITFAKLNRLLIADKVMSCLDTTGELIADVCHNSVTQYGTTFIHRKGAARADQGRGI